MVTGLGPRLPVWRGGTEMVGIVLHHKAKLYPSFARYSPDGRPGGYCGVDVPQLLEDWEDTCEDIAELMGQALGSSIHTVVGRDCLWTYGTSGAPQPCPDSEQSNLEREKIACKSWSCHYSSTRT